MPDQLPRRRPRGGDPQPVDDVVEAALQRLQQVLPGDAGLARRTLEIVAELPLAGAVDALRLLLLAQLHAVVGLFLRASILAVIARRVRPALDRTFVGLALRALEEELDGFP